MAATTKQPKRTRN